MANTPFSEILARHRERHRQMLANMTDAQAKQYYFIWPEWTPGAAYAAQQRIRVGETLYRVLQDHTAEAGKDPNHAPELYAALKSQ